MPCSDYTSISALTEFLDKLVLGVDHEGGVQSRECVSQHYVEDTKAVEGRIREGMITLYHSR